MLKAGSNPSISPSGGANYLPGQEQNFGDVRGYDQFDIAARGNGTYPDPSDFEEEMEQS
jgi:hypothetical protein